MPRTRKEKPLLSFVQDTREQWPFYFTAPLKKDKFDDGGTLRYKLDEGDYSCEVEGVLLPIRIERKSVPDLFGVVGKSRGRFAGVGDNVLYQSGPEEWSTCELERLSPYTAYLLIEGTMRQVQEGFERSMVPGKAAWGSIWCWLSRFGIVPIFAENRTQARDICQRLLEEFAAHWRG